MQKRMTFASDPKTKMTSNVKAKVTPEFPGGPTNLSQVILIWRLIRYSLTKDVSKDCLDSRRSVTLGDVHEYNTTSHAAYKSKRVATVSEYISRKITES